MSSLSKATERNAPSLLVHADGSAGVGAGHLGRILALVQAWTSAHGQASLVPEPEDRAWSARYRSAGTDVTGWLSTTPDVLVVDSYRADESTLGMMAPGADKVPRGLVCDHGPSRLFQADLVIDQNYGAIYEPYRRLDPGPDAVKLGPRYALIRREILEHRPRLPPDRSERPHRLLVAAGGTPSPEVTAFFEKASAIAAATADLEVVPLRGVIDVGVVLSSVDLALSAAGSTTWELTLHGIPTVVVATADNQRPLARAAGAAGLVVDAGDIEHLDPRSLGDRVAELANDHDRRMNLAEAAWSAVDGNGARRAAAALRSLLVGLRRATQADAELLFHWANEPAVRAASFHSESIAWDSHCEWLAARLTRQNSGIWIASDHHDALLGQFRVDAADGIGTIDVSLDQDRRGEGWAAAVIAAGVRRARAELDHAGLQQFRADVRLENAASARAFLGADFDRETDQFSRGLPYHTYTRPWNGHE